jgi:GxxExxY protein
VTETDAMRLKAPTLSSRVIGAAIEMHRALGPGLLESAYETCLCHELSCLGVPFERQVRMPVNYMGQLLDAGYRIDVLVDNCLLVELKAVDKVEPIHVAQVLTYLKLANLWLGLLINFNVPVLKQGVQRFVNG